MPDYLFKKRKVYFLGDDLVSIEVAIPAQGMVKLINWNKDKMLFMSIAEFKRVRRHAHTPMEVADLMNYKRGSFAMMTMNGIIPAGIPRVAEGADPNGHARYYKEETVYTIREILAGRHTGRPRKDGLTINNKVPTESELSTKLNKAYVVYLKTNDGVFVPTFPETV